MLDCYLIPYFGHRKYESISRLDVEQFHADMKCLGVLTAIGFYASGHNLAMKNVAERIEKLPTAEDDEEGESGVIEEDILTSSGRA